MRSPPSAAAAVVLVVVMGLEREEGRLDAKDSLRLFTY